MRSHTLVDRKPRKRGNKSLRQRNVKDNARHHALPARLPASSSIFPHFACHRIFDLRRTRYEHAPVFLFCLWLQCWLHMLSDSFRTEISVHWVTLNFVLLWNKKKRRNQFLSWNSYIEQFNIRRMILSENLFLYIFGEFWPNIVWFFLAWFRFQIYL